MIDLYSATAAEDRLQFAQQQQQVLTWIINDLVPVIT